MTQPRLITPDMSGCWLAGSSNRSADELNHAVILIALEYGMPQSEDDARIMAGLEWEGSWLVDGPDAQAIYEIADDALQYLQSLAPDGYVFYFDDGFYLSAVCDTESYEPQFDECPHAERNCPNRERGYGA